MGVYRKTHLFGAEREAYLAGDSLAPIVLGGRTLGVMVCFDMEFPEVARTLAVQGADLLVTISANPSPFELDHDLFARARALENGLPHVYVNRVGEESGFRFAGRSLALDPDAAPLAEAGPDGRAGVERRPGRAGASRRAHALPRAAARGALPRAAARAAAALVASSSIGSGLPPKAASNARSPHTT